MKLKLNFSRACSAKPSYLFHPGKNVTITDSVLMGCDYYEKEKASNTGAVGPTFPHMGIGMLLVRPAKIS